MFLDQARDLFGTQNGSTVDHGLMQIRIIINKGNNAVIRAMVESIEQLSTGFSCTIDDDAARVRAGTELMPSTRSQAHATDADKK